MSSFILKLWHRSDIETAINKYYDNNKPDISNIDTAVDGIFKSIPWQTGWFVDAKKEILKSAIRKRFNEQYKVTNLAPLLAKIEKIPATYSEHEKLCADLRLEFPQFSKHEMRSIVKQSLKLKKAIQARSLFADPARENAHESTALLWKEFNEGLKSKKEIFREHFKQLNYHFAKKLKLSPAEIDREIYSIITGNSYHDKTSQQIQTELDKTHAILRHNAYEILRKRYNNPIKLSDFKIDETDCEQFVKAIEEENLNLLSTQDLIKLFSLYASANNLDRPEIWNLHRTNPNLTLSEKNKQLIDKLISPEGKRAISSAIPYLFPENKPFYLNNENVVAKCINDARLTQPEDKPLSNGTVAKALSCMFRREIDADSFVNISIVEQQKEIKKFERPNVKWEELYSELNRLSNGNTELLGSLCECFTQTAANALSDGLNKIFDNGQAQGVLVLYELDQVTLNHKSTNDFQLNYSFKVKAINTVTSESYMTSCHASFNLKVDGTISISNPVCRFTEPVKYNEQNEGELSGAISSNKEAQPEQKSQNSDVVMFDGSDFHF